MKNIITNATYTDKSRDTPRISQPTFSPDSLLTPFDEAARMVSEFFTEQLIKEMAQVLISQYFVLSSISYQIKRSIASFSLLSTLSTLSPLYR
jgi:hypothetical protein